MTACAYENEGRSVEAQATLTTFLEHLAGGADDRGWSLLSESTRRGIGSFEDYLALADAARDAELPIHGMRVVYEDDGFYEFAITTAVPIGASYAELLFEFPVFQSFLACQTAPDEFEMAVIIGLLSEHAGVNANSCPSDG